MSGEQVRLAALERTLVAAAARQAQQRRRRRRRAVVLAAVAGPLALAVAGSMAGTRFFASVDRRLSTLRDDRLTARPGTAARLAPAAGARPRDRQSGRSWLIAGHRVVGYTTAAGSFCFTFGAFSGGCLQKNTLTRRLPLDVSTDNGPGVFRVYGLAMDDVVAVTLQARGLTRRAIVGRNAFFLEASSLGNSRGFTGTLVVRFQDGTTRRLPLRVGGSDRQAPRHPPRLPGSAPVGDAAA